MKRVLFISVLVAMGSALSMACSPAPDTLTNRSDREATEDQEDEDEDEDETVTKKKDTKNPVQTPASTENDPTTPTDDGQCSAKQDAKECATCCAKQFNPITSCACGAGSQCAAACGDNLCTGGMPGLECAMCLFQSQCDIGDLGFGGGQDNPLDSELGQCLQQCGGGLGF